MHLLAKIVLYLSKIHGKTTIKKYIKDFAASETNDIKATENPDKMCRTIKCSSYISNLFEDAVGNSSLLASLYSHATIIIAVPVSR